MIEISLSEAYCFLFTPIKLVWCLGTKGVKPYTEEHQRSTDTTSTLAAWFSKWSINADKFLNVYSCIIKMEVTFKALLDHCHWLDVTTPSAETGNGHYTH